MTSIRQRIGYFPSVNDHKTITKIATKEKLSQSKVVDILVEEALLARGFFELHNTNNFIRDKSYGIKNNMDNSPLKYNDLDELISDKGITYNKRKPKQASDSILSEPIEVNNEELFEQFKQFMLFQKMLKKQQKY